MVRTPCRSSTTPPWSGRGDPRWGWRQYCSQLGKKANCQALVSLTLARREVPVCVGLRLFLPRAWAEDTVRRARAGVPERIPGRPEWQIALDELDRVQAAGARFGAVLADAEYGKVAAFRHGLSERGLTWAVGILPTRTVYPAEVVVAPAPVPATGRRPKHPVPSVPGRSAQAVIAELSEGSWRTLSWRRGTKGNLTADFAALRVRVADGPVIARNRRLPGEAVWLVCERRASGERKYYLSNQTENVAPETLAVRIKGRWVCEQMHPQMKEALGLDHFEGRGGQPRRDVLVSLRNDLAMALADLGPDEVTEPCVPALDRMIAASEANNGVISYWTRS